MPTDHSVPTDAFVRAHNRGDHKRSDARCPLCWQDSLDTSVRLLEVHPALGTSPEVYARHFFEKQGYTVLEVNFSQERCKHGYRVVAVTVYDPEEES